MLSRQIELKIGAYQVLGWTNEKTRERQVIGHTGSDNGANHMVARMKNGNQAVALLMNIDGTPGADRFRASIIDDLLIGAELAK
jgi:hypothetical protein